MSEKKGMNTGAKMDLRIRRTRGAIQDAFISLMREKEYASITVTDISERADINRKTFYAHYETKEQLLVQLIRAMFQDLMGTLMYGKSTGADAEQLKADLECFFAKVDAYREQIDTLMTPQTSALTFSIADEVILSGMDKEGVIQKANDVMVREMYVSRIKNFLFTAMDWRMEHSTYSPTQAAMLYADMMRTSLADVFGY